MITPTHKIDSGHLPTQWQMDWLNPGTKFSHKTHSTHCTNRVNPLQRWTLPDHSIAAKQYQVVTWFSGSAWKNMLCSCRHYAPWKLLSFWSWTYELTQLKTERGHWQHVQNQQIRELIRARRTSHKNTTAKTRAFIVAFVWCLLITNSLVCWLWTNNCDLFLHVRVLL